MSRPFRLVALAVVTVWALLGPVGMTFHGCAVMMALCDVPCGAPATVTIATPTLLPLAIVSTPGSPGLAPLLTGYILAVEPPPKPLGLSA